MSRVSGWPRPGYGLVLVVMVSAASAVAAERAPNGGDPAVVALTLAMVADPDATFEATSAETGSPHELDDARQASHGAAPVSAAPVSAPVSAPDSAPASAPVSALGSSSLPANPGIASRFNLRELLLNHRWRRFTRESAGLDEDLSGGGKVTVVQVQEVEVGTSGRARARHALRVQSVWARQWMRSMGLDASECAMQFRAPTKLGQTREGVKFEWQAQVRMGCRF